jgi:hypothetical protein
MRVPHLTSKRLRLVCARCCRRVRNGASAHVAGFGRSALPVANASTSPVVGSDARPTKHPRNRQGKRHVQGSRSTYNLRPRGLHLREQQSAPTGERYRCCAANRCLLRRRSATLPLLSLPPAEAYRDPPAGERRLARRGPAEEAEHRHSSKASLRPKDGCGRRPSGPASATGAARPEDLANA